MDNLSERRWNSAANCNEALPIDALEILSKRIMSGEYHVKHIIIMIAHEDGATGHLNAGSMSHAEQVGLIEITKVRLVVD